MVNISVVPGSERVAPIEALVRVYLAVVGVTIAALIVLSILSPSLAPPEAWIHAVIVAIFAGVLAARTRSARRGGRGALRAVGLIAAVLLLANAVEALVPGLFPGWMRIEMIGIAALMGAVVFAVARRQVSHR